MEQVSSVANVHRTRSSDNRQVAVERVDVLFPVLGGNAKSYGGARDTTDPDLTRTGNPIPEPPGGVRPSAEALALDGKEKQVIIRR